MRTRNRYSWLCAALLIVALSTGLPGPATPLAQHANVADTTLDFNDIVQGPDGAFWLTEYNNGRIARFTPGGSLAFFGKKGAIVPFKHGADRTRLLLRGHLTAYPLPNRASQPAHITVGPDGALWFTEFFADKIGRITTDGRLREYALPPTTGRRSQMRRNPWGIVSGPNRSLWFTESGAGIIGRISIGGHYSEFALPLLSDGSVPLDEHGLSGITVGPDHNLWYTEADANRIARITPTGKISEFQVPTGKPGSNKTSSPTAITVGPDSALWFTESYADRIGRLTTSGTFQEYVLPNARPGIDGSLYPIGIAAGSNGALWFIEWNGNQLGRLGPHGAFHILNLPWSESNGDSTTFGSPNVLTRASDGSLWFAEFGGIGHLSTTGQLTVYRATAPIPQPPNCPTPAC